MLASLTDYMIRLAQGVRRQSCFGELESNPLDSHLTQISFRFIASTTWAAARAVSAMYVMLGF